MVKTTGAADGPGALRPLNAPQVVRVQVSEKGRPLAVVLSRQWLKVSSIEDVWRVEDEWWRDCAVSRTYFEGLLEDGRRVTLFFDTAAEWWYVQRYA